MLGVIGFISAAIAIALFAWSCTKAYKGVDPFRLRCFVAAFGFISAAMLIWAVVVVVNDPLATQELVFATDGLILAGTISMVLVLMGPRVQTTFVLGLGIVGVMLLSYRAFEFPPTAYVDGGLLYFNLEGIVRQVMVGVFAIIWLPISMYFAHLAAKSDTFLRGRQLTLQLYFAALVALFGVFAKAKREEAIIALFGMIVLLFIVMFGFNLALIKARVSLVQRSGHAAKRLK